MVQDYSDNNKRIAKNTLLLYFRMLLTMGISLYTSRVVLDVLGVVDFGIYNVVGGFVAMFIFISGAMTTATQRFLSFEIGKGEKGNLQSLFSTSVIIHFILAIIVLVLAETVGLWFLNTHMNFPKERYVAANWVFQFSVFTFLINVVSVPYNAAIVAYEHMKAFAYVSIVDVCLKLLVVYMLSISTYDKLIVYAFFLALIAITLRVIYGIYCNINFKECRCNFVWNKAYGMNMLSFVGWNLIGSIAGVAKEQGINVLLNIFFGATVNAARGIAHQVLNAVTGFVSNFQLAMNPQIVKLYALGEKKEMFKIVFKGSKYSYLLLLFLSLPVIIETPFILGVWLKSVPEYTVVFIRLILITALIDSLSGTLIISMHASGKVRDYQIIVGGLSLLTLPLTYVLFRMNYPPYMAMVVGMIISLLCHFARLLLLKKSIGIPFTEFVKNVTFRCFCVSFFSLIVPLWYYYHIQNDSWLSFLSVVIITVCSTICTIYMLGLSKDEKMFVRHKMYLAMKYFLAK